MAGIRDVDAPGLPLADLTGFGFELLVRKALDQGWQETFRGSQAYAAYAAARDETTEG